VVVLARQEEEEHSMLGVVRSQDVAQGLQSPGHGMACSMLAPCRSMVDDSVSSPQEAEER
jgi:hypothetical protein